MKLTKSKIFQSASLAFSCLMLASQGCEDTFSLSETGTVRDSTKACAQNQVTFRREIPSGDDTDEVFPMWCGVLAKDGRIYCFETSEHRVASKMTKDGELSAVPQDHPDLSCWSTEKMAWDSLSAFEHPLRPAPRF